MHVTFPRDGIVRSPGEAQCRTAAAYLVLPVFIPLAARIWAHVS